MKFGDVLIADALGAVLAHSLALPDGRLRKGHVLTPDDLTRLGSAGHVRVTVARMEESDLDEDTAAAQLARALVADDLRLSVAATGRVNIFATGPSIARIDAASVAAFNAVNPMITVATVPQHHRLDAGTMIATIKIIAYGVPADDVARAAKVGQGSIGVRTPEFETATLIETQTGEIPSAKGRAAMQGRLDRMGLQLAPRVMAAQQVDALAEALKAVQTDVILILTASATSDPADVAPAALQQAGGTLIQFGMPVDPGNLLFLGQLGTKPVIGLPGCARSPALNGADWVMERVLCGVPPSSADFAAMGVGGLLKEIPTRPRPRGDNEV